MLVEMDAAGVDRAVISPPGVVYPDNVTALEAAAKYPERFRVVGLFDPRQSGAREELESWLTQPYMLGIRMFLARPALGRSPDADWLTSHEAEWFWRDCERLHIPLMIHAPEAIDDVRPLAAEYPGLTLILDHFGCRGGATGANFSQIKRVISLAGLPNIFVKATAAPNFSTESFPFLDIQPVVRRLYDAFGPRRIR
jgi:predicted TIM-barrel fold metal-dependent hydrolase